jgi:predicted dehydrogenase
MSRPLRYALIGATGIGGYHLTALKDLAAEGSIRLAAVTDPAIAHLAGLRSDITATGARAFLDYREMLRSDLNLDVVVIAVPIPLHLEMTLACLELDVFIYLEKPPVPLIQQLDVMIAADRKERVGVGFQMITAEWVQRMKQSLVQGKIGQLRDIRIGACWPRLDNYYGRNASAGKMSVRGEPVFDGPATNALAHLIHNAMYLAGADEHTFAAPVEIKGELYRARPIESYDIACLRGKFRSGVAFSAALAHATEHPLPYGMEVRGTDGWARVTHDGNVFESSFSDPIDCPETTETLVDKTHRIFLEFARGERPRPSTSLVDTRGYVLATNGMLLSSGGIHTIHESCIQPYKREEEMGYDVPGLREAVQTSFQTGRLLSELGLPWSIKTSPVSVENLDTLSLTPENLTPTKQSLVDYVA